MYKLCKTEQSAKRQREIENALFDIMMKKSYPDITVTELCDALSMPRKAFYRYFDSKDDALYALIEHTMAEYVEFYTNSDKDNVRTLKREIEKYFVFWHDHKLLLDALYKNNMLEKIIDVSIAFPVNDMVSIKKFLPDDTEWAREKIFKFAVCGLVFQMLDWYKDGFKTSVSDMARLSCRTLSKPLFPDLDKLGIVIE
jgi:AcrR family transcriptional regulator